MDRTKSAPKPFLVYLAVLLVGLAYYQYAFSDTGLKAYQANTRTPSTQRQSIVGLQQPATWANYAADPVTFRNSVTLKTDYLLISPAGYSAFLVAKARMAVRDSVAPFDAKLAELENSAVATFNDIGYTPRAGSAAGGVMVVGSTMRRNVNSSYSSSSGYSSSSSYSHK